MAVKIRLRQQGRNNLASYRLVVTDVHVPRDGRYVEAIGWYHPLEEGDKQLKVDAERVEFWLAKGAQLTERARSLVNRAAPQVLTQYINKQIANRAKECAKRKARKKAAV